MLRMILAIAVMTAATQLTRYFPFLLFSRRQPPQWLLKGSRLIPGAVMMVLVVYSMPHNLNFTSGSTWIPWTGLAAVSILHLLFRHPLISIFGGTGVYMILLHFFG
jgi:branched-subunit amino acid transport protein AzlD